MRYEALIPFICPASVAFSCLTVALVYLATPSARDRAVQRLPTTEKDYPLLRNSLEIVNAQKSGKFLQWVLKYCIKYQGKPWCIRLIGREPFIVLCCPKAFEDVQKTQFDAFDKSPKVSEAMYDVLGHGIFAVSGPMWKYQRKTASHLFTSHMMQYAMEIIVPAKGEELVTRLDEICQKENEAERVVDMKRLLNLYTMDVFAKVGLNFDMHGVKSDQNSELLNAFDRVSVRILERIQQPMWVWKLQRWLNVGREKQLADDMKVLNNFVYGVISSSIEERNREEESNASTRKDLISLFIEKSGVEHTNEVHTKGDLIAMRDFVMSFLAAGRETTATTMSWVILMLNRYPRVLEQVRNEVKIELPDLPSGKMCAPSLEDIQRLVFLEATIRETLRLFPVVAVTGRSATRDVWLYEGTFIKAGTRVLMPHYAMGRMPTVWGPDAHEFKPERWLDLSTGKIKEVSPFKFNVFLGGPRMCLGMKFAIAEVKSTLAKLLSQFDFKTVRDPFDFTHRPSLTLQIKGPLDVVVSRLTE